MNCSFLNISGYLTLLKPSQDPKSKKVSFASLLKSFVNEISLKGVFFILFFKNKNKIKSKNTRAKLLFYAHMK